MTPYRPQKIYIETAALDSPITHNVLRALPEVHRVEIESARELLDDSRLWNPSIPTAKRSLILAHQKGRFLKACPAGSAPSRAHNVCCGYLVINYASNCHMECTYCYLQSYLNFPYMIVYTNYEDLLGELEEALAAPAGEVVRVGTGELADSLALDGLTGYSVPLVEFFSRRSDALLELKTKSSCVTNLLGLEHRGRTVVSWSLNPPAIQEREEHKTATIEERLVAALRCVEAGYKVAFHFDPLIHYPGWREGYRELIRELFRRIPRTSLAWLSMGSLRLTSALGRQIRQRFPHSRVPLGELVPTRDGKLRYFKPIRVEMMRQVREWLVRESPGTPLYACMEGPDVWRRVFGSVPKSEDELASRLTHSLVRLA